jgi:hypothetical protein
MNRGTTFKCTFCELSVTTLDFNSTNGNRRTQAATVMNQHAASLHLRTSVTTRLAGFLLLEAARVRKDGGLYDGKAIHGSRCPALHC